MNNPEIKKLLKDYQTYLNVILTIPYLTTDFNYDNDGYYTPLDMLYFSRDQYNDLIKSKFIEYYGIEYVNKIIKILIERYHLNLNKSNEKSHYPIDQKYYNWIDYQFLFAQGMKIREEFWETFLENLKEEIEEFGKNYFNLENIRNVLEYFRQRRIIRYNHIIKDIKILIL